MIFVQTLIFCIVLMLNGKSIKAEYPKQDELTLRNQLLSDVFFLKEGVDRLLISAEILNKRFNNQMEILKSLEGKLGTNDLDSGEEKGYCDKITGMFNSTLKKQNLLESRLISKIEELQDDQLTRFEEIVVRQKLSKSCGSQGASSNTLTLLSTTLLEISEKIDKFEEKSIKLDSLEEKLNNQQNKFDNFAGNVTKTLQQINEKLTANQQQFESINKELTNIKKLNTEFERSVKQPRPKLPMEVILGLTSANVTHFK